MAGHGPGPWPAIIISVRTLRLIRQAGAVVTMNVTNFARFERYVSLVEL